MALPFDLRAYAAAHSDDGISEGSPVPLGRSVRRPSRTVVLPVELISRIQQRDVEALRELVQLAYGEMVRFAKTIVGSRDAAEDVVQGIFTKIWDQGPRWAPSGDPVSYLFATVRNHAVSEIRRRERAEHRARRAQAEMYPSVHGAIEDGDVDLLDHVVASETEAMRIQMIETVLATFTERQRSAYDLRYRRGLTVPAIAEVLGITTKSAEQLIRRVTHLVWQRVQQEFAKLP